MVDTYTIQINIDGQDNSSGKLNRVNRELDDLQDTGNRSGDSVSRLNDIITRAGLVTAAWQIADKVNELADLGREAQVADRVFTSLAGGTTEAANALTQMRTATNGAVDNLTLMRGANQLLLTNLASSTDQAAELTQVAVQLGNAMGQDAASAIDNFNSALLNNSFVRLDTLGISAQRVRERVDELKEAGLDMSQAFAQATLEEGRIAIERLGDAANVSDSAFNRLTTQAQNFSQQLGILLADAAETASQLAIIAGISLGISDFGYGEDVDPVIPRATEIRQERGQFTDLVSSSSAFDFAQANPELFAQLTRSRSGLLNNGSGFDGSVFTGSAVTQDDILNTASAFGFEGGEVTSLVLNEIQGALNAVADAQRELNPAISATTDAIDSQTTALDNSAGAAGKTAEAIEESAEAQADALRQATQFQEDFLFGLQNDQLAFVEQLASQGFTALGDDIFFDPAQLGELVTQADELQQRADEIALLAEETDFEIITDDEVANAQAMADAGRELADNAIEAADALERASLSDLFGQTDGGRQGEIFDAILGNIEDEDLRTQLEQDFNLASGRETESSLAFDEQFAPTIAAIAEQFGADAAIAAAQRLDEASVTGVAAGLTQEELVAALTQAIGFTLTDGGGTGAGASTTVNAGEGRLAVAGRLDISVDELNDIIGQNTVLQPGQEITVPAGYQLVPINNAGLGPDNFLIDPLAGVPLGGEGTDSALLDEEGAGSAGRFSEDDVNNVVAIETSMTNMEAIDLSLVTDPLIEDLTETNTKAETLDASLNAMANASFEATIPLKMILDDQSGLNLARSPGMQAAIDFYFTQKGIDFAVIEE